VAIPANVPNKIFTLLIFTFFRLLNNSTKVGGLVRLNFTQIFKNITRFTPDVTLSDQ
jgi:hypothetical protein